VADLRANVPVAEIVPDRVERALGALDPVDVAVVDPPRQGLGQSVVSDLVALRPRAIAAVSCDPASFARDARLFVDAGYALEWAQPVDMFPQTFHVEVVGSFTRLSG
jgi:tRNA/tmRNA/rRNA uracil-C5-methylase (TrmA/RlmC/RlmD family)